MPRPRRKFLFPNLPSDVRQRKLRNLRFSLVLVLVICAALAAALIYLSRPR
jgi:hypothetical protein